MTIDKAIVADWRDKSLLDRDLLRRFRIDVGARSTKNQGHVQRPLLPSIVPIQRALREGQTQRAPLGSHRRPQEPRTHLVERASPLDCLTADHLYVVHALASVNHESERADGSNLER